MKAIVLSLFLALAFQFLACLALDTRPDRELSEAWACRCDTCCETIDRLDYSLDVAEGLQN